MAQERLCLAQNLGNGAVCQIQGWNFSSFARVGRNMFLANEDGLFLAGGETFHGVPIVGYAEFYIDLGQTCRCRSAWLGFEATGPLALEVTIDDRPTTAYTVDITPDQLGLRQQAQRIFLQPHQDKGQYLRLRIGNSSTGKRFALDLVDLVAIPLGHRRSGT